MLYGENMSMEVEVSLDLNVKQSVRIDSYLIYLSFDTCICFCKNNNNNNKKKDFFFSNYVYISFLNFLYLVRDTDYP